MAADADSQRPVLHITLSPLTVTGSHFRPGERVTVLATAPPHRLSQRAVASSDGSFVVQFAEVADTPGGLQVRAMGSEGSAAIYAPRLWGVSPPMT